MNNFEELFNEVFDEDFNIKIVGREKTRRLISAAEELDPAQNFGDMKTGMMNVDAIINLYSTVMVLR